LKGYAAYLSRFGDSKDLFALTVKGESMIKAEINDGDIVEVEKSRSLQTVRL
jgi:repressor LexA